MNTNRKQSFLAAANAHIRTVQRHITKTLETVQQMYNKQRETMKHAEGTEQYIQHVLSKYNQKRLRELGELFPSPYFVRCDVKNVEVDTVETYYFGKFSFPEESIYSWVTPAARMRFESPGRVSYIRPDGSEKIGDMVRKDQYMITDGTIIFFAIEEAGGERELVYQEFFSNRKTDFTLPEIVEQMEKAQDTVIRAPHDGSLAISGPAGSGKTTLALHRIAYLLQSPETESLFPPQTILVLVQDTGTKEYFSHLLPQLGIRDVTITTFSEWAFKILHISGLRYQPRYGHNEVTRDRYEIAKLGAMRQKRRVCWKKNPFDMLKQYYAFPVSSEEGTTFSCQQNEQTIDRVDCTVLLSIFFETHGALSVEDDYFVEQRDGTLKKKRGRLALEYGLVVLDEFQNYLPEQINLIKRAMRTEHSSMMYIGDMAQQVYLGTIREWSEVREVISEDRLVRLQKVYRNTKQILMYISSLGFNLAIPEEGREGEPVEECISSSLEEQVQLIETMLRQRDTGTVGILAYDDSMLEPFLDLKNVYRDVHVMTMVEAQGVEFDAVYVVGIDEQLFSTNHLTGPYASARQEKERIYRDVLYVALTRAMNELKILGSVSLTTLMKQ